MASGPAVLFGNKHNQENYVPTTVSARDVNDKVFEVTLSDVDSVTSSTKASDVTVSCPPGNREGYFIVAMQEDILCRRGPDFPPSKKQPTVKVNCKHQEIIITLHKDKSRRGPWMAVWRDLR